LYIWIINCLREVSFVDQISSLVSKIFNEGVLSYENKRGMRRIRLNWAALASFWRFLVLSTLLNGLKLNTSALIKDFIAIEFDSNWWLSLHRSILVIAINFLEYVRLCSRSSFHWHPTLFVTRLVIHFIYIENIILVVAFINNCF